MEPNTELYSFYQQLVHIILKRYKAVLIQHKEQSLWDIYEAILYNNECVNKYGSNRCLNEKVHQGYQCRIYSHLSLIIQYLQHCIICQQLHFYDFMTKVATSIVSSVSVCELLIAALKKSPAYAMFLLLRQSL